MFNKRPRLVAKVISIFILVTFVFQSNVGFTLSEVGEDKYYNKMSNKDNTDDGNLPPNVGFNLMKKRKTDIVINIGDTGQYTNSVVNSKIESILKPKLDEEKIDYTIKVQNSKSVKHKKLSSNFAVAEDGSLWNLYTGKKEEGISDVIFAEYNHPVTIAVKKNGTIWAKVTKGYKEEQTATFSQVEGITNVVDVSMGSHCILVLTSSGSVYVLGRGEDFWKITPKLITGVNDIVSISTSQYTSFALKSDGTLYAWGYINGCNEPKQICTDVKKISGVTSHMLMLKKDGTVWGVGSNYQNVLGLGQGVSDVKNPTQIPLNGIDNVKSISASPEYNSYIIKNDGTLWGWGRDFKGTHNVASKVATDNVKDMAGRYIIKNDNTLCKCANGVVSQVSDFTLQSDTTDSIKQSIKTYTKRNGAEGYFVHIADNAISELDYPSDVTDILQKCITNKINIVALGTSKNQKQLSGLISKNNNYGLFIDNSSVDSAFTQLANYIANKINADVTINVGKTSYDLDTIKSKINTVVKPKLALSGICANINIQNPSLPENRLIYSYKKGGDYDYKAKLMAYDPDTDTTSIIGGAIFPEKSHMTPDGKIYYWAGASGADYFDLRNNKRGYQTYPKLTEKGTWGGTVDVDPQHFTIDGKGNIYLSAIYPAYPYNIFQLYKYNPKKKEWMRLGEGMSDMLPSANGSYVVGYGSQISDGVSRSRIFVNGRSAGGSYPKGLTVNRDGSYLYYDSFYLNCFRICFPEGGGYSIKDTNLASNALICTGIVGGDAGTYIYGADGWIFYRHVPPPYGIFAYDCINNTTKTITTQKGAIPLTYTSGRLLYYRIPNDSNVWVYDFNTDRKWRTSLRCPGVSQIVKYPPFDVYSGTPVPLDSVVKTTAFRNNVASYFVELSDNERAELNDNARASNTADTLKKNNVKFVGLGRANKNQLTNIVELNDDKGDFFDNTDLDNSLANLAEYIVDTAIPKSRTIDSYMLVTDEIDPSTTYLDIEEDKYSANWYVEHEPNNFIDSNGQPIPVDNSNGFSKYHKKNMSEMVNTFIEHDGIKKVEKVGSYVIKYTSKDKPKGDDTRFDNYRKDSNTVVQTINIVRRPIAQYSISSTSKNTNQDYTIVLEDNGNSYDPDHTSRSDKGIIKRRWGIAKVDATSADIQWDYTTTIDNKISYPVEPNTSYLVSLEVQDIDGDNGEGFWSEPNVRAIGHATGPIAQFEATPNPLPISNILNVDDTSYATSPNAKIVQRVWTITKDGDESFSYLSKPTCKIDYTDSGIGTYNITLTVQDSNGLWSDPYTQKIKVVEDLKFSAKLTTQLSNFSLSSIPASENLKVYHAWTKYFYDVHLEMAMYSADGNTQVTPSKIVQYDSSKDKKTNDEINWGDIIYNIPETLPDANYQFRIMAVGRYGQSKTISFPVTVKTPINLTPSMATTILSRNTYDITSVTSKYANTVQVTLYKNTPYQTSLPMLLRSSNYIKNWTKPYYFSEVIKEGSYIAEFRATTPNGNVEIKNVNYHHINNRPPLVSLSISPSFVYESDDVTVNINATDPDGNKLEVVLDKSYNSGSWTTIYNKKGSPSGITLKHIITDVIEGIYKLRVKVTDPYGLSDSAIISFTVHPLSIVGSVSHTDLWEKHRLDYNSSKGGNAYSPRKGNCFFPGEDFILNSTTTQISPLSKVTSQWVNVRIGSTYFDTYLAQVNGNRWNGHIWDKSMINWKSQTLTFTFTVRYSNGAVKTCSVPVIIQDDAYWRKHLLF